MMNDVRIFLDMDGVLCDFCRGAWEYHGIEDPYLQSHNRGSYDIDAMIQMDRNKFWEGFGHDFWANLPMTKDAIHIVETIREFFPIEQICLLSSPTLDPGSLSGKMTWIRKYFPQFNRRYLLGPKKFFCAAPNALLIDDHDNNIELFRQAGGHGVLVPRPWNSLHQLDTTDELLSQVREGVSQFSKLYS